MELTYSDQLQLDKFRLARYLELSGPILANCTLIVRPNSSTLAIYISAELPELAEHVPDLRLNAGIVLGLGAIAIYHDSKLIGGGSTTLHDCASYQNDYDYQIAQLAQQQDTLMVTATATAPTQTTNGTQSETLATTAATATIQSIPELRSLGALAQATGQTPQAIAEQIIILRGSDSLNCLVALNPATGEFMASDTAIQVWINDRIAQETEQIVADRREALLQAVTPSATEAAAKKPAKPKTPRASKPKPPKMAAAPAPTGTALPARLKSFKKGNSYSASIKAFFSAQGWPTEVREAAIAAMASETAVGKHYLNRIVGKYPKASQGTAQVKLLDTIKKMVPAPVETGQ